MTENLELRKFKKITMRWKALFTFRTTDLWLPININGSVLSFCLDGQLKAIYLISTPLHSSRAIWNYRKQILLCLPEQQFRTNFTLIQLYKGWINSLAFQTCQDIKSISILQDMPSICNSQVTIFLTSWCYLVNINIWMTYTSNTIIYSIKHTKKQWP